MFSLFVFYTDPELLSRLDRFGFYIANVTIIIVFFMVGKKRVILLAGEEQNQPLYKPMGLTRYVQGKWW